MREVRSSPRSLVSLALRSAGLAAAIILLSSAGTLAQAVEYVRICDSYGEGFHYHPGTEVCLNEATNQALVETAGGTWPFRVPSNPAQLAPKGKKLCKGKLVALATIAPSDLELNAYDRFETTAHYPVPLAAGEYIAAVVYQGGFSGQVRSGNFCLQYRYDDPVDGVSYTPLGCLDTKDYAGTTYSRAFTPDKPQPPVTPNTVTLVGANGFQWTSILTSDVAGSLSISLCIQKAP